MTRIKIHKATARMQWLEDPALAMPVTGQTRRRFSAIVPVNPFKRAWFRVLRLCLGERGRMAEWTRTWRGRWRLTILQGQSAGMVVCDDDRHNLIEIEKAIWFQPICDL